MNSALFRILRLWHRVRPPKIIRPKHFTEKQNRLLFADMTKDFSFKPCMYGPPFQSPWIAFPNIPSHYSIGWRMGGGESFMIQFCDWYHKASDQDRAKFREENPEPENYAGFFDIHEKRILELKGK